MTESNLEQKIIDNLQVFLLELGKGFSFVGRQYRITLDNDRQPEWLAGSFDNFNK